ncbi:MAG: hypothetical protein HQM10_16095 [Candidatus Riflebacteria bacterium]|nr:hypothetical protein [Candidatus Riflebacteria bacterium]
MIFAFFLSDSFPQMKQAEMAIQKWIVIVAIFTLILGIISLLKANIRKISEKAQGWGFNLVLIISFIVTFVCGFLGGFSAKWKPFSNLIFQAILAPAAATMVSLLAFFIASAAFRSFRIRSMGSAVLFLSAVVVMLGNVPMGDSISHGVIPRLRTWILEVPSSGAQTAIIIGAAAGYIISALKLIFGIEKPHLGGES